MTGAITGGAGGGGGTGGDAGNEAANDGGGGGAGAAGGAGVTLHRRHAHQLIHHYRWCRRRGRGRRHPSPARRQWRSGGAGIAGTNGVVINNATIDGAPGGGAGGGTGGNQGAYGAGVTFTGGGTVTNNGGIYGAANQVAVNFGTGTSRLIFIPGATFGGIVTSTDSIGTGAVSTLELGTSTNTGTVSAEGTLTSLGTNFQNFASVQVDPGAFWNVGNKDNFATGVTLTDEGTLLDSGKTVAGGGAVVVDNTTGVSATETVTASGNWSGMSKLTVGAAGAGSFVISNKGTAGATSVDVGSAAGSSGEITVTGSKSALNDTGGSFTVGDGGQGSLTINAGAAVTAGSMIVGGTAGTTIVTINNAPVTFAVGGASGSSVDVSGPGSGLTVTGLLQVGTFASGSLEIDNGAIVSAGSLDAGVSALAVADINVSGVGTALNVTNGATIADDGNGVLSVLDGATVALGSLTIGALGDSSGAMIVSGTGSTVDINGALNVGTSLGTGELTVGPGASVNTER